MQGRDRRWGEDSGRFVSNVYLLSRQGKGKRIDASALSCVPLTYSDRELLADVAEPAVPELSSDCLHSRKYSLTLQTCSLNFSEEIPEEEACGLNKPKDVAGDDLTVSNSFRGKFSSSQAQLRKLFWRDAED